MGCLIILGVLLAIALLVEMKNEEKINEAVDQNTTHRPEPHAERCDHGEECRWGHIPAEMIRISFWGS